MIGQTRLNPSLFTTTALEPGAAAPGAAQIMQQLSQILQATLGQPLSLGRDSFAGMPAMASHPGAMQGFGAHALVGNFSWAGQVQAQLAAHPLGMGSLESLMRGCRGLQAGGASLSFGGAVGFAAMPDFRNSGHLEVDKQAGTVTTPGGFKVTVKDGKVSILNPDGKSTELKAEPPTRTVTSQSTRTETRQQVDVLRTLPGDPVVRESDGDVWRYQGTGSFVLPDGTKITIQETGEEKGLHINKVDIYNGNQHVSVDSKLTSADWRTVNRSVQEQAANWQTTSQSTQWEGRNLVSRTNQQRDVLTTVTEQQRVEQKFQTTFSDVTRDGFRHDAANDDGKVFGLAGAGEAWRHQGREVLSGAGKGKDDPTKAYQLGERMGRSNVGYRPLQVPWNVFATHAMGASLGLFQNQWGVGTPHWQQLGNMFGSCQPRPHLPIRCDVGPRGLQSMYGGPVGASALFGNGWGQPPAQQFGAMRSAVMDLCGVFAHMGLLSSGLQHARWGGMFV